MTLLTGDEDVHENSQLFRRDITLHLLEFHQNDVVARHFVQLVLIPLIQLVVSFSELSL